MQANAFRVRWFCLFASIAIIEPPPCSAGDARADSFINTRVVAAEKFYSSTQYYSFRRDPRSKSSDEGTLGKASFANGYELALFRKYYQRRGDEMPDLDAVAQLNDDGIFDRVSISNPKYRAALSKDDAGEYVLDSLEPGAEKDTVDEMTIYATGCPVSLLGFPELLRRGYMTTKESSTGDGVFTVLGTIRDPNGGSTLDATITFNDQFGVVQKYVVVNTSDDYRMVVDCTYQPDVPWMLRSVRQRGESLTARESPILREVDYRYLGSESVDTDQCYVSFYGLPEPPLADESNPRLFYLLLFSIFIAAATWIFLRRMPA